MVAAMLSASHDCGGEVVSRLGGAVDIVAQEGYIPRGTMTYETTATAWEVWRPRTDGAYEAGAPFSPDGIGWRLVSTVHVPAPVSASQHFVIGYWERPTEEGYR